MSMSAKTTKHGVSIRLSGVHADNFVKAAIQDQTQKKAASAPEKSEMKSFEQLGHAARDAFVQQRVADGVIEAYSPWDKLPEQTQAAWTAAAKEVAAQIAAIH